MLYKMVVSIVLVLFLILVWDELFRQLNHGFILLCGQKNGTKKNRPKKLTLRATPLRKKNKRSQTRSAQTKLTSTRFFVLLV